MKLSLFALLTAGLLTGYSSLLHSAEVRFVRQTTSLMNVPAEEMQQKFTAFPLMTAPETSNIPLFYTCSGNRNGFEFALFGALPKKYMLDVTALRDNADSSAADRRVFRILVEDGKKAYQFRECEKRPVSLNLKRQSGKTVSSLCFSLNMDQLYRLSGSIPFASERRERWQIIVRVAMPEAEYRVWDSNSKDTIVLCEFPVFHGKDLAKIRSDLYKQAAAVFFDPNAKGVYATHDMPAYGEPYAFYLNHLGTWYGNRKLWTENFRMPVYLSFPMHQSWMYYFDSLGVEEPVKQLRAEQRKYAQKMASRVEDPLTGEAAFEEAMAHFTNLLRFWEQLRGQGLRTHIYSAGFGGKE